MKVTVLGTSNAWGPNPLLSPPPPPPYPMVGTLATGQSVPFRKYRTSLLVETSDKKKILVDCGPDFADQLRDPLFESRLGDLDAILITHPHLDHIGGLDELNLYRPTSRLPIPTYATSKCWDTIKNERGLGYIINIGLVTENHILLQQQTPSFYIGSVKITPFPVEHHPIAPGAVGFVFQETQCGECRCVLYTGDLWAVSNPNDALFAQQFDVAIIECDRSDGLAGSAVGGGHMSLHEAARMLESGVFSNPPPKQVAFVHFGDNGPEGTASTYQDWRDRAIDRLGELAAAMNHDWLIGYEGLTL